MDDIRPEEGSAPVAEDEASQNTSPPTPQEPVPEEKTDPPSEDMRCHNCGAPTTPDSMFCMECGGKIGARSDEADPVAAYQAKKRGRVRRRIYLGALVLVIAAGGVLGYLTARGKLELPFPRDAEEFHWLLKSEMTVSGESAAEEFGEAGEKGDVKEAERPDQSQAAELEQAAESAEDDWSDTASGSDPVSGAWAWASNRPELENSIWVFREDGAVAIYDNSGSSGASGERTWNVSYQYDAETQSLILQNEEMSLTLDVGWNNGDSFYIDTGNDEQYAIANRLVGDIPPTAIRRDTWDGEG